MTTFAMPIDYRSPEDDKTRMERIERELWLWRVAGIIAIVCGMALFVAGLWALGRAGMF